MARETLALVEIENAGEVSAELGHTSGELFLAEFEDRVGHLLRGQDEVIKIQPNKLCVLLRGVWDPQQIQLAGAKLTRLFEAPIEILDEEINAAVHAAFVPPGNEPVDPKMRLRIAEAGLAEARKANEPFVVRDAIGNANATVGFKRAREVELAFERGEFVMYFQPKIHAAYRNVVGAEALMRWHVPNQGVRLPGEFLPYAESASISRSLTWFSIKSAVAQCAGWPETLSVAVNIPPTLLHDPDLVPTVQDALAIFGVACERLTLEITEEAMIAHPEQALVALGSLRDAGVRVAIDDFGTGFSSLAYFRDLPVDELKIDRSFVSQMLKQPKDHGIVKAIIDLAHNFSMQVVAEGIEDEDTADALQALGCDTLQGFWIGKPIPADQFGAGL
ncbi:MAG: bifunctional diguanylate cyclase/phosphodiesterase [Gammaproteobacteria bacterium]|nr:bifunctional diguanylate cyclase/phosphodiesterase [Gammaproteobacteria bacterium]